MPRFRYTAANAQGKTVRGVTNAPSEEALYTKLRDDGLYMTDAQEAQKSHSAFRPPKTAMLADFCRNLGTLLAAGVPLVRAIRIMADERNIDARQKALYEAILGDLRPGVPEPAAGDDPQCRGHRQHRPRLYAYGDLLRARAQDEPAGRQQPDVPHHFGRAYRGSPCDFDDICAAAVQADV